VGIDTKGVVVTQCKDVFKIRRLLEGALRQHSDASGVYTHAPIEFTLETDFIMCNFVNCGNQRRLFVFFGSDNDYQDLGREKIVLLLGAWGNSVQIMKDCLGVLKDLGYTYIWEFDAIGDFKELNQ
jgi:hypothetical protein